MPNYRECQILLLYKFVCSEWNVYNVSVQVYSFIIVINVIYLLREIIHQFLFNKLKSHAIVDYHIKVIQSNN